MSVPVTAIPLALEPDQGRVHVTLPAGLTIAELIEMVLPGLPDPVLDRVRVVLSTPAGSQVVPRDVWHLARPHEGVHVVIQILPGKDALRTVLTILVSIAASAISGFIAGPAVLGLTGTAFNITRGLLTLGLTALGGLLINALLPQETDKPERPTYAIAGWRNQLTPDAPVPVIFGKHRYAPPFAAYSYIEVVGDLIYDRAVFIWGYGPLAISDLRLGDTPLDKYDEVEVETRQGYPDDEPLTLYTQQAIEEKVGTDLERLYPRDDAGETDWDGTPEANPVSRLSASDVSHVINILSFPAGLIMIDKDGDKKTWTVEFKRRYRLFGSDTWTTLSNLRIKNKKQAGFFRADRIDFPARGRYEIEYERLTPSEYDGKEQIIQTCTWVVIQSFRPESPFNFAKPVAMTALRIKATSQLNGQLDSLNGIVQRIAPDWDADTETWVEGETRNPASGALFALRGPALYQARDDAEIDLAAFAEWHAFCKDKGLEYNRIHDFSGTLGETLAALGAAGRAAVRWDGQRWTVVIDRPRDLVVDHINPRNSSGLRWQSTYFEPPHALRVPFLDETNDYQQAERLVPWPPDFRITTKALLDADLDHAAGTRAEVTDDGTAANNTIYEKSGAQGGGSWAVASMDVTEEFQLPGKTNPDEIWIETRRRQYELLNRAVSYQATQLGTARTATSGDLVMLSQDVLRRVVAAARVVAVRGDQVEIDEKWVMDEGASYAIRFRTFDADDTIGESVVRTVATVAGETSVVTLTGSGIAPEAGDIVHFGPADRDSIAAIVTTIERGKNNTSILSMLPAAPIIDDLTDAEVPPLWDGRVGAAVELPPSATTPVAPIFTGIVSGFFGTGNEDWLEVQLAPGSPDPVVVYSYELEHRLSGAGSWSGPEDIPVADGGVTLTTYHSGDDVELRARSVSTGGQYSPYGATVTVTVGNMDATLPSPLAAAAVTVGLGHADVSFVIAPNTVEVRLYRQAGTGGTLDPDADLAFTVPTTTGSTYSLVDGDGTRVNLLTNPSFATDSDWTKGFWTISGGKARFNNPSSSFLTQTLSLVAGATYRARMVVSEFSAGDVRLGIQGATSVYGGVRTANGTYLDTIVAPASPAYFMIRAPGGSAYAVDDVILYLETAACLPQGSTTWWLQPFNKDGRGGPVSGPFTGLVV